MNKIPRNIQQEKGQWPQVARFWPQLGSPLRPVEEDLCFIREVLSRWHIHAGRAPRVLILGVTPEFHDLPWPEGSVIRAVDRTPEMIDYVWPGSKNQVLQSDWLDMEWPEDSFDLVLCDGGLHLLDYPRAQSLLAVKLATLMAPGGKCIFRLFVPPVQKENPEVVIKHLLESRIPNLNCLKLRLGMALLESAGQGVALQEVWRFLHQRAGDWPSLASRLGWSLDHLQAIDAYRDSPARYYFVSLNQAKSLFHSATDSVLLAEDVYIPRYAMGEQCPVLVLGRK